MAQVWKSAGLALPVDEVMEEVVSAGVVHFPPGEVVQIVVQTRNQVIASTNQLTLLNEKEPETMNSGDPGATGDDKDKKNLPVCK